MGWINYQFRNTLKAFIKLPLALILFVFQMFFCAAQEETVVDTTKIDTIIIRWEQNKVKIIPRGVKKISTIFYLNRTKALATKPKKFVPTLFWTKENKFGLDINEVAFVNWNAGGENAISGLTNVSFVRNYKFRYISWNNELRMRYGINAQEDRQVRKTDDFIRFSSAFGYRTDTITPWYYSAKLKFNTQFSNGFKYPNRENPISRFMAPGYLFLGAGVTYQPETKKFVLYMSPLTQKATFVMDDDLSNQGAFGVEKGKSTFMELGFLVTNTWEKELIKNVLMNHRLNVYTDYIRSFGNIDVDWEMNFNLKVNQYIKANIGTHLIYDDDIKFDEVTADDGTIVDSGIPKVQFKQLLGIGFAYEF